MFCVTCLSPVGWLGSVARLASPWSQNRLSSLPPASSQLPLSSTLRCSGLSTEYPLSPAWLGRSSQISPPGRSSEDLPHSRRPSKPPSHCCVPMAGETPEQVGSPPRTSPSPLRCGGIQPSRKADWMGCHAESSAGPFPSMEHTIPEPAKRPEPGRVGRGQAGVKAAAHTDGDRDEGFPGRPHHPKILPASPPDRLIV